MIEIHWFAFLGWIGAAFMIGWIIATRRANKELNKIDKALDDLLAKMKTK